MGALDGRPAVVVGGASGIGLATVRRLVAEGARVGVVDRDADRLAQVADEVERAEVADVRHPERTAEAVLAALPDVDGDGVPDAAPDGVPDPAGAASPSRPILVNCAGTGLAKPLHTYTDKEWRRLVDVNLSGTFYAVRAMVPVMLEAGGGAVVNVASLTGVRPTRGEAPYSAAKAGVIALTQSIALEYAPTIRANTVSPGMIDTPLTELVSSTPDLLEAAESGTPLGRIGRADEVAEVVLFLASDASAYVTGQNVVVDGGSILPSLQSDALLRSVSERFGGGG